MDVPNPGAPEYLRQTVTQLTGETDSNAAVGDSALRSAHQTPERTQIARQEVHGDSRPDRRQDPGPQCRADTPGRHARRLQNTCAPEPVTRWTVTQALLNFQR